MRTVRLAQVARAPTGIALLLVGLLAAGCGGSPTTRASTQTSTPTTAASPTATVTETPTASPTATPAPPCNTTPQFASATRAGDLLMTNNTGHGGFSWYADPGRTLLDVTSSQPLQVQWGASTSGLLVSGDPATNPIMNERSGGFEVDICNASATQTHTMQAVTARVNGLSPLSGSLQEWSGGCQGEGDAFDAKTRQSTSLGCGGGPYSACEYMHASFLTTAGAGATVITKQTRSGRDDGYDGNCPQFGPLPVALAPGVAMSFNIGVTAPTAAATYTFAFGFVVDGAAPAYIAVTPTLLAPIGRMWSGQACTSAMQAQIPTTKDDTYYICPQ